jgi:hypothetical protein
MVRGPTAPTLLPLIEVKRPLLLQWGNSSFWTRFGHRQRGLAHRALALCPRPEPLSTPVQV